MGAGPLVAPLLESHVTDGLLRRELTLQSFTERKVVTTEGSRHRVFRARLDKEWFALKEFTEVRGVHCMCDQCAVRSVPVILRARDVRTIGSCCNAKRASCAGCGTPTWRRWRAWCGTAITITST